STILFLGTTGDASLTEVVEPFTRDKEMDGLHEINTRLGGLHDFTVNQVQQNAVLALPRLAGESAIPRLQQLYEHEDIFIRILAALSLYSLGDNSGYELLSHFVNHTQCLVPEIDRRWSVDLAGGSSFQDPIIYLQSPRTDKLLLQRLCHSLDTGDRSVFESYYFRKYWDQILPVLADHLDSRDRNTRKNAHSVFKLLTDQDFGFQEDRFAGQQDEVIERWKAYIERWLLN
ncbi:MAG: HEAT repeat domain-containing protein, partial [Planctomycetes bacterium]|nr:HEAT repeat domain-containing protein [Planctomycetota bacterium]